MYSERGIHLLNSAERAGLVFRLIAITFQEANLFFLGTVVPWFSKPVSGALLRFCATRRMRQIPKVDECHRVQHSSK